MCYKYIPREVWLAMLNVLYLSVSIQSINHHHYTGGHVLVQHKKTEHKTIQSGMKSLMRVFCIAL